MAGLKKVRVQLLDEKTGSVLEEVDVLTSADSVTFSDGETFQQKLDSGKLKGQTGPQGPKGTQEKLLELVHHIVVLNKLNYFFKL